MMKKKEHLDIWRSKWWQVPPHFHFPVLHLQLGLWSAGATESLSLPQEYTHSALPKDYDFNHHSLERISHQNFLQIVFVKVFRLDRNVFMFSSD